jgi:uncharacterized membrane protein
VDEILLILLGIAWAIGTPLIAIMALVRASGQRSEIERLSSELAAVRRQMAETSNAAALPPPFEAPVAEIPPPFEPEAPALPAAMAEPVPVSWEQRLGGRAFLWIGAITLALAAIFLVRYSIEEGWLSPEVRVILAAVFGFVLIGVAERLRGRDERVAQALAAAGVAALYGSLFAAVALYDMISKVAAGGGATALTAFAIGVSLRHGILVAALAFVGGFMSPAIIGSETPNTPVLFGYLLAIAAGTLAVIRARGWWPLGWGVLAGSALWTVAWMMSLAGGLHWVGLFLVAVAGLFVWAAAASEKPSVDAVPLVWSALAGTGVLLVAVIVQDQGRQVAGWVALALHGAGLYALSRRVPRFQDVALMAPALSVAALLLCWTNDNHFEWAAALLGGFYAAAAFALLWNAARPGFWAALSVAAALAHFLACWYVLRASAPGTPWGLISVGLAVPFLVGAERLARWRASMVGASEALGVLAAGVVFFVAAAIALELRREAMTVAFAVEFAAVAAIANHLDLVAMRRLCWPLLAVVLVRFVLNPEVLNYPLGTMPVFNWILWSYGVSIAALVVGLRFIAEHWLRLAAEAAIALLGFVLLTLEVRSVFQPQAMAAPATDFMERAFYVLAWGGFALGALWLARSRRDPVALWAWRLSGGLAIATALVVQTLIANPLIEKAEIGRWPILNGLLLAYAMPAAMAAWARRWIDGEPNRQVALVAEATASILAFVYVSLEVRHLFDPGFERPGLGAEGLELYTYSIVWLLFGVVLLALGFVRGVAALRHAGMVLVCIVVAKVFLIDIAGLQGLLRVLSFLGLGAALVGLGYAYRRFAITR